MPAMPRDAHELERYILDHIPLARAMALRVADWDGTRLELVAPLDPNVNDKDCAFGGSLSGLMTLAGWGATVLRLAAHDIDADVFVARSEIRYLTPLYGDLRAGAQASADQDIDAFMHALRTRGRARLRVDAAVAGTEGDACIQCADFAARLRENRD